MEAWTLGVMIGLLIFGNVLLMFRLELCNKVLSNGLERSRVDLIDAVQSSSMVEISPDIMKNLKEDLTESILDTIQTMRPPTALDHVAGAFVNIMQMREQWKIQKEANEIQGGLINPVMNQEQHGPPQESKEEFTTPI